MLNMLNLFTGIDGLGQGALRTGKIKTQFCVESDPFNREFIERNLGFENAGDINHVCVKADEHPALELVNEDKVPVEEGKKYSPLCIEDYYEGVLPYPDIICGGFPCVDVSSCNLKGNHMSISGKYSGLVHEQLRIVETLESEYVLFENVQNLKTLGLEYLLSELSRMGYNAQWGFVSAVPFKYPQYRHRVFVIGYMPGSDLDSRNGDCFAHIKSKLQSKYGYGEDLPDTMDFRMLLPNEDPLFLADFAVVKDQRSIPLRTKRINGLGNCVIPDIAEAIFDSLLHAEGNFIEKPLIGKRNELGYWVTPDESKIIEMPFQGYLKDGQMYSCKTRCKILNPTNKRYENLWKTLISRDGNNNFNKSRPKRKGGLGGVVAQLMSVTGCREGGLCPEFAEYMMGFEPGYTELAPK